jgi:putative DNA primase/helicase
MRGPMSWSAHSRQCRESGAHGPPQQAQRALEKDGKRKKDFPRKRPDPDRPGAWINDVKGVPQLIYRLPKIREAIAAGAPVLAILEGEKKADLLWLAGIPATCSPGGAKSWKKEHGELLRGTNSVVIVPDNDDAGRNYRDKVAKSLSGVAASIRLLELPGLSEKGDVLDWINEAGNNAEALRDLIDKAPPWAPAEDEDEPRSPEFSDDALALRKCSWSQNSTDTQPKSPSC